MNKEELRREVKQLVNKCVYLNKMDFIDVVHSHFENVGIYEYSLIDNAIEDLQEYVIYKKYQTDSNDFSYATRTTNGKREISVSTCTDDSSARLILWAKEG